MGGWNTLQAESEKLEVARLAVAAMVEAIREVDRVYSVFDMRSSLSQFNSNKTLSVDIDDESLLEAIGASLHWAGRFEGMFDPTVEPMMRRWGFRSPLESSVPTKESPSTRDWDYRMLECDLHGGRLLRESTEIELDSGGWAKGLAAERAVCAALAAGAESAMANCGGDIFRAAKNGIGTWECVIRDPLRGRFDPAMRVRHRFSTVATSGNIETFRMSLEGKRVGHLMDPRTGMPAQTDLLSITVFGHQGLAVDAASSGLFVMGSAKAKEWLVSNQDFAAVMIDSSWPDIDEGVTVIGDLEALHP